MKTLIASSVTVVALLVSGAPVGNAGVDEESVHLEIPDAVEYGDSLGTADQVGDGRVEVDVVSLDGGSVDASWYRGGHRIFDFPAYDESLHPPRAVVRVTPRTGSDDMAPEWKDFTFGAEIRRDAVSFGSEMDDGDNFIQRGLSNDESQYKLDSDNERVSCKVRGTLGAVIVTAPTVIEPNRWYELRCNRHRGTLRLSVTEYLPDGTSQTRTATKSGMIGSVKWSDRSTPLAIGGKLKPDGDIVRYATDQFNGRIADPMVEISER